MSNIGCESEAQKVPRLLPLALAAGLIVVTVAAFLPLRSNDFIELDDNAYITKNPQILKGLTPDNAVWAFTHLHYANWHPLTTLSNMLDVSLFGLNAPGHHLVSLGIHVANTLLLFFLLWRMTARPWVCALAAALFALHPMHVEPVAWASSRKDVLSTLFLLAALHAYVSYVRAPKVWRYGLVVICFILGFMSKFTAFVLPVLLLLLDYWPLRRLGQGSPFTAEMARRVWEKAPLFLLSILMGCVGVWTQRAEGGLRSLDEFTFVERLANAVHACAMYCVKTVLPFGLTPYYPHPRNTLSLSVVALSAAALLAVTLVAWLTRRRLPFLITGWLWYLASIAPTLGVVAIGAHARADRFAYVPLIGIFMAGVWGVAVAGEARPKLKPILCGSAAVLVLAAGVLSWRQAARWKDGVTLFEFTLRHTERNATAHAALAEAWLERGQLNKALEHMTAAMHIEPGRADGLILNAVNVLIEQGRLEDAQAFLEQNPDLRYHQAGAYYNLGNAYMAQQEFDRALDCFLAVLKVDLHNADARINLAAIQLMLGNFDSAATNFYKVLREHPGDVEVMYNLALALQGKGDAGQAAEYCRQILKTHPDYAPAIQLLENLEPQRGKGPQ